MVFSTLNHFPYFTLEGYKQLSMIKNERAHTARVQLSRWEKAGHLIRLKRGIYMPGQFYIDHHQDAEFLPAVSAIINPRSYISSTYILQRGGILTDITYPVTAITLKNTRTTTNKIGTFTYQHVRQDLYQGFTPQAYFGITFYQAALPKALFDYLYLRSISKFERSENNNLAEQLRLNLSEFSRDEQSEFAADVEISGSQKMKDVLVNFKEHLWQP